MSRIRLNVQVPEKLHVQLKALSKNTGLSMAALVSVALAEYFRKLETASPSK